MNLIKTVMLSNASTPSFGPYVQLRRGSVAGYTTDESWVYGPKEGIKSFKLILNTYLIYENK